MPLATAPLAMARRGRIVATEDRFVTHGSGSDVRRLIQRQEQQAAVLAELTSSRSHGLGRRSSLADALRQRTVNETLMNLGAGRWLLVTIVMLVAAASPRRPCRRVRRC